MQYIDSLPYWQWIMSNIETGGGSAVGNDVNAGRDFAGRDVSRSNVNVHFDRAGAWDPEREELTDRQRIRDLEIYVFGDSRGLTIGVIRTLRNYLVWLIIISVSNVVLIALIAYLIVSIAERGL